MSQTSFSTKTRLLIVTGAMALAACQNTAPTAPTPAPRRGGCLRSGLHVVNGIITTQLPEVVQLSVADGTALCTGTFVSSSTLITAAHCLGTNPDGNMKYNNIRPLQVFHHGATGESASTTGSNDQAIILFPEGTAPAQGRLANRAPRIGDAIVIAGYGQVDFVNNSAPDGQKRFGSNTISDITDGNALIHYQSPVQINGLQPGQLAMSGRGDSGGPLFLDGGIIATTSNGGVSGNQVVESDVSVFSAAALELLERATAGGAVINGIDAVRIANGRPAQNSGGLPNTPNTNGQSTIPNTSGQTTVPTTPGQTNLPTSGNTSTDCR